MEATKIRIVTKANGKKAAEGGRRSPADAAPMNYGQRVVDAQPVAEGRETCRPEPFSTTGDPVAVHPLKDELSFRADQLLSNMEMSDRSEL